VNVISNITVDGASLAGELVVIQGRSPEGRHVRFGMNVGIYRSDQDRIGPRLRGGQARVDCGQGKQR
jgi:hypothetical protein